MSAQLSHPSVRPVKGSGVALTGRRVFSGIGNVLRMAYRRTRSRRILSELDDRMLRDIGLTRDEAATEFRKPFWV